MTLGEYIKSYRASHSIGQREFAQMCGISAGYVSMLENNKNPKSGRPLSPRIEIYQQVAAATGIGLDGLIAIIDDNITVGVRKEQPTATVDDGLDEKKRQLIDLILQLPPEDVERLLKVAELILPPQTQETD